MSKYKQKTIEFQTSPSETQKTMLCMAAIAIVGLSAHIADVAGVISNQIDASHGIIKAVDDHHHVHSGDILIDRRNVAQYNSEEKSTSDRDRDNWEVYENALAA
jgi:hypothetical protein